MESLKNLKARQFVLDGEIVIPLAGRLSFDELLMRIHSAESRVRKLGMLDQVAGRGDKTLKLLEQPAA